MAAWVVPGSVWATPTGLNNIPTAEVVPEKTLVFQVFGNLADRTRPDYWAGFKYGAWPNLEIGFDGQLNPEPSDDGVLAGQVKYRLGLLERTALSVGIANFGDRARNGYEDYYAVVSRQLGALSLHVGGTLQNENEGVFAGLDHTLEVWNRDLTLRGDIRQTHERDDVLVSMGFIVDLGGNVLLESWGSFPSESAAEEVLTIKLNYVVQF